MNKPNKPGLIVCVQTHGWRQYRCNYVSIETTLIDILANNKDVVGLRVDSPALIFYAKGKYKNMFILGMYKDNKYPNYITPTLNHYNQCIEAGADAVAVDFRNYIPIDWAFDKSIRKYIWPDVDSSGDAEDLILDGFPIVSSTFCVNQSFFASDAVDLGISNKVNIEGSVDHRNINNFFKKVRHVTIGRAIHDPNTIIKGLIG